MKLKAKKNKPLIVSRPRTIHPWSTPLALDQTVLNESADIVILGVMCDAKMIQKHVLSVSKAASQRLGIMKKTLQVFMTDRFF